MWLLLHGKNAHDIRRFFIIIDIKDFNYRPEDLQEEAEGNYDLQQLA